MNLIHYTRSALYGIGRYSVIIHQDAPLSTKEDIPGKKDHEVTMIGGQKMQKCSIQA